MRIKRLWTKSIIMEWLKLAKIKDKTARRIIAKMWFTSEVIRRMEEYEKEHYGTNRK